MKFASVTIKGKFHYLLIFVTMLMVLYPFLEKNTLGPGILALLVSAILLSGVYASTRSRRSLITALFLGIPTLIVNWISLMMDGQMFDLANHILFIIFYGFVVAVLLKHVLAEKKVTLETLYGVITAYLLIGIAWATLYLTVEELAPGSFQAQSVSTSSELIWSDLLYYSFVTLTSLGYGDIIPVTAHARSLTTIEGVIGVLFVAILIARLVRSYDEEVIEVVEETAEENAETAEKKAGENAIVAAQIAHKIAKETAEEESKETADEAAQVAEEVAKETAEEVIEKYKECTGDTKCKSTKYKEKKFTFK